MMKPSSEQLAACRDVLIALARSTEAWPTHDAVMAELAKYAAQVAKKAARQVRKDDARHDEEVRSTIRHSKSDDTRIGEIETLDFARERLCYVCRRPTPRPHSFYAWLCPSCGEFNLGKRNQTADLTGRVALVTGGRIGSGYHVARKLLRAGAEVVVASRFPNDAYRRFQKEPDAARWQDRLRLVGLDLRLLGHVEAFCAEIKRRYSRLDLFVANAAQTVRRPPAYYRELAEGERTGVLPSSHGPRAAIGASTEFAGAWKGFAESALIPLTAEDLTHPAELFPRGDDGSVIDLRAENSWGLPLERVSTVELIEVQAVNVMAPFLMLRELQPLMRRAQGNSFAVMVSASEGQFAALKTGRHPHTNMAKAALNMLVRTSAEELAKERIFLCAVDPGWFSPQSAATTLERLQEQYENVPLDAEDAAARILDPLFAGLYEPNPPSGVLFKNYRRGDW